MFHIIQNKNSWWIVGFGMLWFSGLGGINKALQCAIAHDIALSNIDLREVA